MVVFGATGDLTKRKLVPALYNLAKDNLLSKEFALVGVSRDELTTEEFRDQVSAEIREFATTQVDPDLWHWFARRIYFVTGTFDDPDTYQRLTALLGKIDHEHGTRGNYFYYLATAPGFFGTIIRQLGDAGLVKEDVGWRRAVIEKPFGRDYETACRLNAEVREVLEEHQIYRIDHYLGKETVQNILVFRFSNGIFEPIWNRQYIDHVQITVAETVGVEQRGGYYETSGTLRDMVPNHIFQLLCLTAMEPPVSFEADVVRDEQAKILKAMQPMSPEDVIQRTVRGQYGESKTGEQKMPAYRSEDMVSAASNTETYVAMKLFIDNWRWADVPFYIRTGKRMPKRDTEIFIQFKRPPSLLFRHTSAANLTPNRLILQLQPDEGISLSFGAKIPGPVVQVGSVNMNFSYKDYFHVAPQTGYERLLYDCMMGDATLFQRSDMVESGWQIVGPVLDVWGALPARNFPNYPAGSWGPKDADELLRRDGREWNTE
jgi:glucose-6-phosphate 1-dehydrogenase